jgi:peptide/nickel transport system ATP-binding protein
VCDRIAVFYAGEIVESGPAGEIIARPQHPYTQALLRVASVGDFRRRELEVIAGQPPQVGEDITGCRFAARCPVAVAQCAEGPVGAVPVAGDHHVRCVHAGRAVVAS